MRTYCLTLVAIICLFASMSACSNEPEAIAFSQLAWSASPNGSDERYAMAKDLTQRKLLVGATRDEVIAALGPGGGYSEVTSELSYALGGPVDPTSFGNTLKVRFDENGRAKALFIYRE